MKIISVFGTRPEAIKMAPLVKILEDCPDIESQVLVTAQHREMLDQVLHLFDIHPDYDLNIMRHGQTLEGITTSALEGACPILHEQKPDLVLVHGDTTTTFVAALAAFYEHVPCGHVEAGLRTFNKYAPFPEEMNRHLTGVLADYHFAPTAIARENLLREGIDDARIVVTGNTVIDALLQVVKKPCSLKGLGLDNVDWDKRIILLTCHRRENWGAPMQEIFTAVREISRQYQDVEIIFPVHKNPIVRNAAQDLLEDIDSIHLCEPLDYLPFSHIINRSYLVLTDSGGMQEEAPALGKPVLVLRETTERPEAIEAGTALLAGNRKEGVIDYTKALLDDYSLYQKMAKAINPYGDGHASEKILESILNN